MRYALERRPFQHARLILRQIVEESSFTHEETTIDEVVLSLNLLREPRDGRTVEREISETRWRMHAGDSHKTSFGAVKIEQGAQVDIGKPVTVRKQKVY